MVKVAVFNDTSFSHHFGCDAVMATLRAEVGGRGGKIVYSHAAGKEWRTSTEALAAIRAADIVIVNGEGTIHHSLPAARSLAQIGDYAARNSARAFLINATIQGNALEVMNDLRDFDRIWVRDSVSLAEVEAAGGRADVVGDLSFGVDLPQWQGGDTAVVTDSVVSATKRDLAGIAHRLGAQYVSLIYGKGGAAFRKRWFSPGYSVKRRKPLAGINGVTEFAAYLGRHDYMITGRFHGLCLAISAGIPVSAMRSNTAKNESLLADIGLDMSRFIAGSATPVMLQYSDAERRAIASYLERTRAAQQRMFEEIFAA